MRKNNQKCKGFEVFQRLNYLFQIKDIMARNPMVSSYYGNLLTNIAKKSVLKIDPGLKRQICKRCKSALLPGETVDVRVKRKCKKPLVIYKCKHCGFDKRYPIHSDKKIWTQTSESVVGVIDLENSANASDTHGNKNDNKQKTNENSENAVK